MASNPLRTALIASLLAALLVTAAPLSASASLSCSDLPDLMTIYFQKHVRYRQFSDAIRDRTIETYLRRLDPQRVLFLQEDVNRLSESLQSTFREIQKSDCTRLRDLQQEVVARQLEIEGFVRGFVGGEDYQLDPSVELQIDPDERGHPKSEAERDALLRVLAHFGISNYLSSGSEMEEAKGRLIHRYELQTRRTVEKRRDQIYAEFLDSFANALDPHSSYLSADDVEDFQIQMQLSLEGIGVALSEQDGYAVVEQIIPGGAADRLKVLEPEDKIIAVAEEGEPFVDVIDMALRDVVRLIRGKKGTRVQLTVLRQTEQTERFMVAIERDTIDLKQQAAKLRFETVTVDDRALKIAVLDLPSFYGDQDPSKRKGSRDVARLLRQAVDEKADGLVLDLSRNGGGLLEDAVAISGFFIDEGGIVAVKESNDNQGRVMNDPEEGVLYAGPMVVLISRWSASASEILAGALKDYRRALIVGDDHTFGKGTVQSVFPLRPGLGALKITTALFFRPGGKSTQKTGVSADVVLPSLSNLDIFGEKHKLHSLSAPEIPAFRSDSANGDDQETHWKPVEPQAVTVLVGRSKRRVQEDETFQEIEKQLAERESDDGVVQLAEIMREREEANGSTASSSGEGATASPDSDTAGVAVPHPTEDDEAPTPQVREAVSILTDMITLNP